MLYVISCFEEIKIDDDQSSNINTIKPAFYHIQSHEIQEKFDEI